MAVASDLTLSQIFFLLRMSFSDATDASPSGGSRSECFSEAPVEEQVKSASRSQEQQVSVRMSHEDSGRRGSDVLVVDVGDQGGCPT